MIKQGFFSSLLFFAASLYGGTCTPPFQRHCPCEHAFYISGDFLYWQAFSDELEYAWKTTPVHGDLTKENVDRLLLSQDWDIGFRAGIGYGFPENGWTFYLNWTRFHTSNSSSVGNEMPLFFPVLAQPISDFGFEFGGLRAERARGKWSLSYDTLDFEAGRDYCLSACLHFYPQMGFRIAWIDQHFKGTYKEVFAPEANPPFALATYVGNRTAFIDSCAWGIGPRMGFTGFWYLGYGVSLLGEVGGTLLCTDVDQTLVRSGNDPTKIPSNFQEKALNPSCIQMWPNVEMGIGFNMGGCCFDLFWFEFEVKYEAGFWWANPNPNLSLHGLTLKGRIQF